MYVYDRPSLDAGRVSLITADTVFNIYGAVLSDDVSYNRHWLQVRRGYVYSGQVQPVRWQLQTPGLDVSADGFLGEVTVPYTISKTGPHANYASVYRLYYQTTHWVKGAKVGEDGAIWYKVFDDRLQQYSWAQGEHLRQVPAEELTPLAPEVQNKRIEINLEQQTFQCFEGDVKVLDTLCSTGVFLRVENGQRIYGTPAGDWVINRKRPSRHMAGDDLAATDFFDLPGVPWVSYFHWWGVSIHGTYWHNDYGRPHSHGCINLPPDTAKWVFRWTTPIAGLDKLQTDGAGTRVSVI
jgi:lipoprotein-anchoring transpeptidase ErfK/SrfK